MSNISNQPNSTGNTGFSGDLEARLQWFRQEFLSKHGTKLAVAFAVIVIAIVAVIQYRSSLQAAELLVNEDLGKAFQLVVENKTDSAQTAFTAILGNSKASSLQQAKAALLLGNIQMQKNDIDGAAKSFETVLSNAGSVVILKSGAEHGLATIAMEKQDYPKAISLLQAYIKDYGKRTGDLEERFAKKELADPITLVPDAMWKLTLVYAETKDTQKAKETAENLVKIYGESPLAVQARKFLATL